MKFTKIIRLLVLCLSVTCLVNCAETFDAELDAARFELDQGNYDAAIDHATSALSAQPGNPEAARVLANAYLGRSGIDFLDVAQGLTDLENSTDTNFQAIAAVLPSSATLADLRSAITTLETLSGIDSTTAIEDEELADAVFDLAIMQMVEHFAIGVYQAGYDGDFDSIDVSGITDAGRASVLDDLVDFDNRMIASGVESTEGFIDEVRQTYCILEPLSAGSGFTTSEYRALVGCQLSDSPATFDTVSIDAAIATCAALDPTSQGAAVEACYDTDTAL